MQTTSLFVDTSGWMAYLVASEDYHALARQELDAALDDPTIAIYTTDQVLAELVALMQGRKVPRAKILGDVDGLLVAPRIVKLFTDEPLFYEAWALLLQRADKAWSLADAISMLRMQRLGVTEVLTNDHHFTQAGFVRLLT
jgi:predicted nucleic acid-binding protein